MVFQEALSQVSVQNITSILEDLLKDYDKTERPSYKDGIVKTMRIRGYDKENNFSLGKTTQVKVNMLIRSMGPISEMKMVK